MNKITKRNNWHVHSPPSPPFPPQEPKQFITKYVEFHRDTCGECLLAGLVLPTGKTLQDVYVEVERDYQYEGSVELVFSIVEQVPNKNFDQQLIKYQKDLSKYNTVKQEYEQEVKEWKQWVKQEEQNDLNLKLEHAENLLKKHGRL
jgi:hypothetical protein